MFPRLILAMPCFMILTGCINPMGVSEPHPGIAVPERWTASEKTSAGETAREKTAPKGAIIEPGPRMAPSAGNAPPADPALSWLLDFDDATLRALVLEATKKNFRIGIALARVKAARVRAEQKGAEKLPEVTANLGAARARSGLTGSVSNTFDLGMDISFDLDLWNRLDNAAKAALAEAKAEEADYRMTRLSLAADVANAWLDAIEREQQLRLADKTIRSFETSLSSIVRQYRLGIGSALDVRLARENLATARARRESRARDRDTAARALEVLLGRYPAGALPIQRDLPALRREIPAGLPSDLLHRRPDLIAAKAKLLARGYDLAAAKANRLPGIRLTASGGTASDELGNLLRLDSLAWSILGGLTQPIWDAGRLSGDVEIANADRRQAAAEYAQAALQAFRQVESALMGETLLANQETALAIAAREARAATVLAMEQYQRGLADIVTLLSSQRREFDAESALLSIRKERLRRRVDLYLALGGGF